MDIKSNHAYELYTSNLFWNFEKCHIHIDAQFHTIKERNDKDSWMMTNTDVIT